ncbi:MAG TPA: hypothetical protein V6D11_14190 [Waterburya sp.]
MQTTSTPNVETLLHRSGRLHPHLATTALLVALVIEEDCEHQQKQYDDEYHPFLNTIWKNAGTPFGISKPQQTQPSVSEPWEIAKRDRSFTAHVPETRVI